MSRCQKAIYQIIARPVCLAMNVPLIEHRPTFIPSFQCAFLLVHGPTDAHDGTTGTHVLASLSLLLTAAVAVSSSASAVAITPSPTPLPICRPCAQQTSDDICNNAVVESFNIQIQILCQKLVTVASLVASQFTQHTINSTDVSRRHMAFLFD